MSCCTVLEKSVHGGGAAHTFKGKQRERWDTGRCRPQGYPTDSLPPTRPYPPLSASLGTLSDYDFIEGLSGSLSQTYRICVSGHTITDTPNPDICLPNSLAISPLVKKDSQPTITHTRPIARVGKAQNNAIGGPGGKEPITQNLNQKLVRTSKCLWSFNRIA